jgi:hypothetical protein
MLLVFQVRHRSNSHALELAISFMVMNDLNIRALRSALLGTLVLAALLCLPAWTLDYWQGWVFVAVLVGAGHCYHSHPMSVCEPNPA